MFASSHDFTKKNLNGINKTRRRFGSHIIAPATGARGSQSEDQLEFIPSVSNVFAVGWGFFTDLGFI